MANPVSEIVKGVLLLPRGFSMLAKRPKLFWRGAIPPLISSILFIVVLVVLVTNSASLAAALTPFADDWSAAGAFRAVVAALLVVAAVILLVVTFSALTLTLGAPIYDSISESLERELGGLPEEPDDPVSKMLLRSGRQALALIALSVVVALLTFLTGLIPVGGAVLATILGSCLGGWLIAIDMVGSVFERRGLMKLADRQARLTSHRWRTLGFCAPTFLLLSVPLVAIFAFPVAKAAATLLARQLLDEAGDRTAIGG